MLVCRASDLRAAKSSCWYFGDDDKVGCCYEVKDDEGRPLGFLVMEGQVRIEDPLGKVQHGVTVIVTGDTCDTSSQS